MSVSSDQAINAHYILVQWQEDLDENLKRAVGSAIQVTKNAIAICDELQRPHLLTEIGKERIRRAAKKIAADNPGKFFDGGFRVFKLADTNMADVYYSAGEYDQSMLDQLVSNIKPDRTDLDLLFGCLLEWGKSFCWSLEKDTCLRPGRNGSLTGKKISMWTLFFITVCSAAMC